MARQVDPITGRFYDTFEETPVAPTDEIIADRVGTASPDYFGGLRGFLQQAPAPTTGFIDRDTAQARWRAAIAGARGAGAGGTTPFMERYLQSQFDPLYRQFSLMTPGFLGEEEESPIGFMQSIRAGDTKLPMGSVRDDMRTRVRQYANWLGGTSAPKAGEEQVQFDRYFQNPEEQRQAAFSGATAGVHPLFRSGTVTALNRLYDELGGEEMDTPFLTAAKAAGYFG